MRDSFNPRQMSHYFGEPLSYKLPFQLGSFGLACIAFAILPLKLGTNVVLIAVLLGVSSIALGAWRAWSIYHYPPTDEEYDGWVGAQLARMMDHAAVALHAGSSENLQIIDTAVLPGSKKGKKDYQEDEVKVKRGKDGIWRYSVHDYTFVLPGAFSLATFNAKVSALNWERHEFHATTEYMYADIVGMTTHRGKDELEFQGTTYIYAVEECAIQVSNGGKIEIGAAINAHPIQKASKLPTLTTVHAPTTINMFRDLLRNKKQASYGLPSGQTWSGPLLKSI